jgi:hypothetical protein
MFEKGIAFWYIHEERLRAHARRPDVRLKPTMPERYGPARLAVGRQPRGHVRPFPSGPQLSHVVGLPLAQAVNR